MTHIYLAEIGASIQVQRDDHGWYADVSMLFRKIQGRLPYTSDEGNSISMGRAYVWAHHQRKPCDLYLGSDGHYTDETQRTFYLKDGRVIEEQWGSRTTIKDVDALVADLEETNARMRPTAELLYKEHGSNIDLLRCAATDHLLVNLRTMSDAGMIKRDLAIVA